MHNVAKSRMQTFQREASRDEIKKAHLYSLLRLSPPAALSPFFLGPVYPFLTVYPIYTTNTPLCPVRPPLLPSHPITPDPTPLKPQLPYPHAPLAHLSLLGPQTQTAQNVVDRIQKFKRFEAAAAPPGQLKLKSSSTVEIK